ncbi:MAG: phosphomannomutase/phosphoglucomutase [Deltaproteobacteria bacterium]|jgi:phosphomannomutase|nr:phosphomannomutase/phosphoglucomutase [Deltaproteobacteria bacterium]
MAIFKAYDIRGIVPDELDTRTAYGIGRAIAHFMQAGPIAVGRDARVHSPELAGALMDGILDEGLDVLDLGLVSTPMLYFGVEALQAGAGVMVTASHNPGEYNGFKVCRAHAIPVGEASGLREIEALVEERAGEPKAAERGRRSEHDVREGYAEHVLALGRHRPPLKVAIDCGNGMASVGLEKVLEALPVEVVPLYFEPDGRFPNHEADPLKLENLADLSEAVRREGADFGVAFDGDGDRAVFVDGDGEPVSADLATALIARHLLDRSPGSLVLYDLRSSRVVAEEIERSGGVARICRVGHSFVKTQMREEGAVFAGELSGHLYFRFSDDLVADDATAAFVALLDVLGAEGRSLAELVKPLRCYAASGEINSRVADVRHVLDEVAAEHLEAPEVSHLDGLLVRYPTWWFNLRPSNTEPVLRLNLEADTEAEMVKRRDAMLERIASLAGGAGR